MNNRAIERNLGLFYGFHSQKLREIVPIKGYLEFEKDLGRRRVDIFFEEEDHDIYIEIQIRDSDISHLKQILRIIGNDKIIDDTKIIWIATGFDSVHLEEVKRTLKNQNRRLEFYALLISSEMVQQLEAFSDTNEFVIIDKLSRMLSYDDTEVYCKFNNYNFMKERKYSYKRLENPDHELVKFYIKEIRNQIPNWINAYNSKVPSARRISFGAGVNDISFLVGINRYERLAVEVQFSQAKLRLFRDLYSCRHMINEKLELKPIWDFKKHKIHYSIPFNVAYRDVLLEKQVSVLKRYLEVLYPLIQHRDEIGSVSSNDLESFVEVLLV